jgi:hypothetical protein
MEIIQTIIEDLKFYQEMDLTPTEILFGEKAWREVMQEAASRSLFLFDASNVQGGKLFGVNVRLEPKFAPWARSYRFKEALG